MSGDVPAPAPTAGVHRSPWAAVRAWPWWVHVLLVWAASRLVALAAFLWTATRQEATYWADAHPSYPELVGLFYDAGWYERIAVEGYPSELPRDADGLVQQSAWAFFPVYPGVVRLVMSLTGGSWTAVAPTVALVLGAVAALLVHEAVRHGAPRGVDAWPGLPLASVALTCAFPTAAVLQVAYTESAALLLVAAALLALVRRRYAWCAVAVVTLGLTRAVALPMAVVVAVHAVTRWRRARRGEDELARRDVVALALLTVTAGASGLLWPAVCGFVTGVPDGYLQTQEAWRGVREVMPFTGWTYVPQFWFGAWGPLVVLAGAAVTVVALLAPSTRRLGPELHAWSAAYLLYIVAVIEPGSSLARFLLLAFPLAGATAGVVVRPRWARRAWFTAMLLLMLGLQVVWIRHLWHAAPGGDWPP